MSYFQIHLTLGGAALFLLSRSVSILSVSGLLVAVACVLLGPVALAAAGIGAMLSAAEELQHGDHRAHDPDFYKQKRSHK